jgi:hypothetical protein
MTDGLLTILLLNSLRGKLAGLINGWLDEYASPD